MDPAIRDAISLVEQYISHAWTALLRGEPEIARLRAHLALSSADSLPNERSQMWCASQSHLVDACCFIVQQKYEPALECLVEADEAATANPDARSRADSLMQVGSYCIELVCAKPFLALGSRLDIVSRARWAAASLSDESSLHVWAAFIRDYASAMYANGRRCDADAACARLASLSPCHGALVSADLVLADTSRVDATTALLDVAQRAARTPYAQLLVWSRRAQLAARNPGSDHKALVDEVASTLDESFLSSAIPREAGRALDDLAHAVTSLAWSLASLREHRSAAGLLDRCTTWPALVDSASARMIRAESSLLSGNLDSSLLPEFGGALLLGFAHSAMRTATFSSLIYTMTLASLERGNATQALWLFDFGRCALQQQVLESVCRTTVPALPTTVPEILARAQAYRIETGTLALVFLWDNRRCRLGVFLVRAPAEVSFFWFELDDSAVKTLLGAAQAAPTSSADDALDLAQSLLRTCSLRGSERTLADILREPAPSRIFVVPHGPVIGLPIHVAIRHVCADVILSYAPKVAQWHAQDTRCAKRGDVALFAYDEPEMQGEIHDIAKLLELARLRATRMSAEELELRRFPKTEVMHIASHGRPARGAGSARSLASAAILLKGGKDGPDSPWLSTTKILSAYPIVSQSVVLTVCDGARSIDPIVTYPSVDSLEVTWGIDFLESPEDSLATCFLLAGAREVVAFPYPIHSHGARLFAARLYEQMIRSSLRARDGWAAAMASLARDAVVATNTTREPLALVARLAQHWVASVVSNQVTTNVCS